METKPSNIIEPKLQLVAWEITRSCNLLCAHCRAAAHSGAYENELSTHECYRVLDDIAAMAKPIIILTGGEPLARADVFDIARHAIGLGLRVVMGTNGTLITPDVAAKMKAASISRVGVSLDFPTPDLQDRFRGKAGAFQAAVDGINHARAAGVEVQINATVTKLNAACLDDILALALKLGAVAFHPFLLVPTGRGKGLESVELTPQEYEDTLNWIYDRQAELGDRIFFKPTDAPHYMRVVRQRGMACAPAPVTGGKHPGHAISRGCLAGTGFCFISHQGRVQGCGYLDVEAGNVRQQPFPAIWKTSPLFQSLRDLSNLKGKCGDCEFKRVCGGCRARAYEATGDCLEAEPYCIYQPRAMRKSLSKVND